MATTSRWGLRYPLLTDAPDVPLWMQRLASDLDDVAKDDQGTLAARPVSTVGSPGKAGRYYYATDTGELFRDAGTGWVPIVTGIDPRLTNSRAPSGAAGGDLAGTYPNPTIGAGKVTAAHDAARPGARILQSTTAVQSLANSTVARVLFPTTDHLEDGVTVSNNGATGPTALFVPRTGTYVVTAELGFSPISGGFSRGLALRVGGTAMVATASGPPGVEQLSCSSVVRITAGAAGYIDAVYFQDTGAPLNTAPVMSSGLCAQLCLAWVGA